MGRAWLGRMQASGRRLLWSAAAISRLAHVRKGSCYAEEHRFRIDGGISKRPTRSALHTLAQGPAGQRRRRGRVARLPFGFLLAARALHILTITVHHGPGVSDRCFLGSAEAANTLHAAGALVLDLRQEGSHLALGRIDALIARLSSCHDLAGRAANNCTISQQSQYFHSSVSR